MVQEIVCLSVFVLELVIMWSPVSLLRSLCDLCHAMSQAPGQSLKVALAGWVSLTICRISHWFRKKETALDPLPPLHVFTSQLQRKVLHPQRNQVTLCTVPPLPTAAQGTHSHHSFILQALSWSEHFPECEMEVSNQMCPLPERMSY